MNFNNFKFKSKNSFVSTLIAVSFFKIAKQNNILKSHEEPKETEIPITLFDSDDPEFEELQQILNDPNIDPEMYREIMMESKNIGLQPIKFNQLHAQIKNDLEEDSWHGLRIFLNWRPTNLFSTETVLVIDDKQKGLSKYRISATTIVPGNFLIIIT